MDTKPDFGAFSRYVADACRTPEDAERWVRQSFVAAEADEARAQSARSTNQGVVRIRRETRVAHDGLAETVAVVTIDPPPIMERLPYPPMQWDDEPDGAPAPARPTSLRDVLEPEGSAKAKLKAAKRNKDFGRK